MCELNTTVFLLDLIWFVWFGWFMVFNATFNNISVISWQSILLVEETGVSRENHQPAASHWQTLYHVMVYRAQFAWAGFKLTTLVVTDPDCISSYRANYHTITTTTAPILRELNSIPDWFNMYLLYNSLVFPHDIT